MIALLKTHPFFADKTIESCSLLENQGYCNENYILLANGVKYIVRKLLRDDIDRAFEWKIHTVAYTQGITAEALVFDVENSYMVFAFLEGVHKEKLDEHDLKNLVRTVQKLHSIKIDTAPIVLEIQEQLLTVKKAFRTIIEHDKEYVLCHNDINPQNVFFSQDVKFIDWEYAGVNDKYFDLACVCVEFGLDEKQEALFLNLYFRGKSFKQDKLIAYKVIYSALCEAWFNVLV